MVGAVKVVQVESSATTTATETKLSESTGKTVKKSDSIPAKEFIYYTVRKGDNFWTIAKKFPGVTNTEIMKTNRISSANSLKVGQKLKIRQNN
jgi:membrane-bound lytic murein transglycosylase D